MILSVLVSLLSTVSVMRPETVLSPAVLERLEERLGGVGSPGYEEARRLVQFSAGHVWVWSWRDHQLLLAGTGDTDTVQTIQLEDRPDHEVTGLTVSRTGLWVAVWGPGGLTALQMPPRVSGRFGGGRERLSVRGVRLHQTGGDVQMATWHPASQGESHLVTLTRSGLLSLHNLLEPEDKRILRQVRLRPAQTSKLAAALGEAAVDFCFGSQPQSGSGSDWPLFVVSGNCDVHCVTAGLGEAAWEVEGPLEVRPRLEDNYSGGEGCGLIEQGGVLALATTRGVIYHAIILGGDTTSLHVYEKVELEIGAVASRDVFSSPLSLSAPDWSYTSSGYLVSHPAGLHSVSLPMVGLLRTAAADGCLPDLSQGNSLVSHLVCTRPASSSPPAPPLGACLTSPLSSVLCLLATNSLKSLPLPRPSSSCPPLLASQSSPGPGTRSLDSELTSLLSRQASQPLLAAAPTTSLSPALSLELLTGVTSRLRREYLARLEVARQELERRVGDLQNTRRRREADLTSLEKERVAVRDRAELLSEKYEDVKDRGQELSARVENVLSKLQVFDTLHTLQSSLTIASRRRPRSRSSQTRSWRWRGRCLAWTGRWPGWREESSN